MESSLLAKISRINQVVLESKEALNEKGIVEKFVESAVEVMGADYGYFFEWNNVTKQFQLLYKGKNTPFESQVPRRNGVTARAFEGNQAVYISHAGENSSVREDAKSFMKGVVIIPVSYEKNKYGVLDLCFYNEHSFTDEEKTLCEFIGNSAAQMITIHRLVKSEQEAHAESENQRLRFRAMIENSYDVIALLDEKGVITDISNSVSRMSGYPADALLGHNIGEFIHTEDAEKMQNHMLQKVERPNTALTVEARYRHVDGSWRWLEASGVNKLHDPNIKGIIANIRDVTQRKQAEDTIREQAMRDSLTGLPNRQEFAARFEQVLSEAKRHGRQFAVMFLDMDRFKNINDRLGHSTGDAMLKVVASRLSSCLRAEDIASRFGGDEFLVLINETRSSKDVVAAAEKILKSVNLPVKSGDHTLYPSVSIGIAIYPHDGLDLEGLKKNADIALYRAKANGRNRFSLYDHSLNGLYQAEKFTLENELREALLSDQISVYYQPIIDLKKSSLVAVEALARWVHPKRGLLLPREFISLAEEAGLISELDKIVLKKSCQQAKAWQEIGLPKFRIAVNLSAQQFSEPEFVAGVAAILAETGLQGGCLELEITESLAMGNLELTSLNLQSLKKLGVKITIDDFGTGYSSLNYLKRFPINGLKIDKSFVRHCITNPSDTSITQTIAAMAKTLNLKVTAEGVEESQQLDFLRNLGCDAAQGFFIAEPMPAKNFPRWFMLKYPGKTPSSVLAASLTQAIEAV